MSYISKLANRVNEIDAKDNFKLLEIDIEKLIPSTNNFYGIRDVEELAESIKDNGLIHNLVVRKTQEKMYEILSGERRYSALKQLGYTKIPCKIVELNDIDSEILLIQANARQRELTPIEKMNGLSKLKALYDYKRNAGVPLPKGKKTRDLIGEQLGMSGSQVAKYQAIENNLIEPLKDKLNEGDITLTQASTLSSLKEEEQEIIHDQIKDINSNESKEEVDILVRGIKQPITRKEDETLLEEMYSNGDAKEEVDALVKRTRQAVEIIGNKEPMQVTPEPKQETPIYSELEKLLEYDPCPKLIIDINGINSILYTTQIKLHVSVRQNLNDILSITLASLDNKHINTMSIPLSKFEKLELLPNGMRPKKAYWIHEGVYLWFKRKVGEE